MTNTIMKVLILQEIPIATDEDAADFWLYERGDTVYLPDDKKERIGPGCTVGEAVERGWVSRPGQRVASGREPRRVYTTLRVRVNPDQTLKISPYRRVGLVCKVDTLGSGYTHIYEVRFLEEPFHKTVAAALKSRHKQIFLMRHMKPINDRFVEEIASYQQAREFAGDEWPTDLSWRDAPVTPQDRYQDAVAWAMDHRLRYGHKINLIKAIRNRFSLTLRESKKIAELM
ncbi:hypothetical protein [Salisaeta icosahedral phage 1]|uniref:hypothetical protein n=1 Tax=Salisaeta icosahedral phage 1 TaxID=1183239 RepID=UPI00025EA917|nr:hypothetical protein A322_gp10 [Salisaeta icosahedral phage 1]AFJ21465.1 hypothetical protein [Salisaeta icosahedral phage 1]